MKRMILAAGLLLAGVIAFAGTCTIQHTSLNTLGSNKVFGGEIHNDSGANFLQHKIHVAFFNSSNQLISEQTVTPCLRSLPNGGADYFSAATSTSATAALARLEYGNLLTAGTPDSGSGAFSGISITRTGTALTVSGTFKNTDATLLSAPNVCAVVYDSSGNVVVVGLDETLSDLAQNATDTFSITLTVANSTSTVSHVDLHADGLHGNTPIRPISSTGLSVTVSTATPTATPTNTGTPATATPTNTPTATATP